MAPAIYTYRLRSTVAVHGIPLKVSVLMFGAGGHVRILSQHQSKTLS